MQVYLFLGIYFYVFPLKPFLTVVNQQLNCQTVWKKCLDIIREEIPEQSFKTWFTPIKPIRLEGDVMTIEVPTPFFYEWLEEHYVVLLKKAITSEIGPTGKLEYSIVVDKGGNNNQPFTMNVRNSAAPKKPSTSAPQDTPKGPTMKDPFQLPQFQASEFESYLNPAYTFESFIEGDCNRLARSAGMAIARRPGATSFNPFVLYGGVGLGKTHLAHAVGNEIKANFPNKIVLYTTAEQFTTQFIESLKNNEAQQFNQFYLQIDVLIMDDIQFLSGKEKTQETFFHLFNRLHQSGKQIIMTSDRPPRSLQGLQERLLSRFKWGLTADLQQPDYETRCAIVQSKISNEGVDVPNDVIDYIAYNVDSNIRELEGVLISLIANASFMRKEIDMELAKTTLLNIVRSSEKEVTVEFIQEIVADYFKIPVEDLRSKTRKKDIATARQIAMYFSQQYTTFPLKHIGDRFGGRDHSTVVHAAKTVQLKSNSDAIYGKILTELSEKMQLRKMR